MPCYHPLAAWYGKTRTTTGRRPVVFSSHDAYTDRPLSVPCGRCIGCRLEHSRQWALRCIHEAQLHQHNLFATLTYSPEHLPPNGSLRPLDFVLFMKRLRKQLGPGIRFYQCGEYGEQLARPHHHAILFNCHLPDQRPLPGRNLTTSPLLQKTWGHGHVSIGQVTFESAAYVARYTLKRITGPQAENHYRGRIPEYGTMSRRPGIGSTWLQRYKTDVYPNDSVILRGGIVCRPPRYYDNQLDPETLARLKRARIRKQRDNPNNTGSRLIVREAVKQASVNLHLTRGYENGT